MGQLPGVHEAFGLRFTTGVDLWVPPAELGGSAAVDLTIDLADAAEVHGCFSGSRDPARVHEAEAGGRGYRVERGRDGDHLLEQSGVASFHLGPEGKHLRCAPDEPDGAAWRRFLLDTVLGTAALLHGFEALHAGAFAAAAAAAPTATGPAGVVALVAPAGAGKSTLLAEFVSRGHPMVSDDILVLSATDGSVMGHPGPPVMSLPDRGASGLRCLAVVDGERWLVVDRPAVRAMPLAVVVFLERDHAGGPSVDELTCSVGPLLAASLDTGPDPNRRTARFALLADLAAQARLLRLACPPDLPAPAAADLLEGALDAHTAGP